MVGMSMSWRAENGNKKKKHAKTVDIVGRG